MAYLPHNEVKVRKGEHKNSQKCGSCTVDDGRKHVLDRVYDSLLLVADAG